MNSLILSLAPLGGLGAALPAMAAAECDLLAVADSDAGDVARSFARHEGFEPAIPEHDRNGGYLLL